MAKVKFNEEDGVWRTIGGRRVFIQEGQSLSSAMKKSGKFKTKNKLGRGLKDLDQEKLDGEGVKEILGANDKAQREEEFGKKVDEMYNRFHGKTDKQIAEEIAKERGERLLTDKEQKEREIQFMKNLEKETEQAKAKYEHAQDKYEHHKFDDNESESKQASRKAYEDAKDKYTKASRDEMEARAKEAGKSTLVNEYNKTDSRGSMSDDAFIEQARKAGMSDENIAKEVYKKHNGPESNNTSDNNIKRLLAKQKKEESIAKGDKDTASRFEKYEKEFESRTKTSESSKTNENKALGRGLRDLGKDKMDGEGVKKLFDDESFARRLDKEDVGKWVDNSKSNRDGSYSEIHQSQGGNHNPFKKGEYVRYDYDKNGKRESVQSYKTLEEAKAGKTTSQAVPKKSTLNTMTEKNADIAEKIIEDDEWNDIRVTRYGNGNTVIENERTGKNIKITPSDTKESLNKKIEDSYKESKNSNDWVRNAFNDYKKEHPNSKMTFETFKKSKK